jgi:hypothetical protein
MDGAQGNALLLPGIFCPLIAHNKSPYWAFVVGILFDQ